MTEQWKGQLHLGLPARKLIYVYEDEIDRLRAQRDELLAALRDVADLEGSIQRVMHRVRAAIAGAPNRQ
jgi:hypothetical protein